MADVGVKVELQLEPTGGGFGLFVLDSSVLDGADVLASDEEWVDITDAVSGDVVVSRGRNRELGEYQPGRCSVLLEDPDRTFDPDNTGSPYYGNIQPMREIRVMLTVASTDYPLFRGYIQEWPSDYGPGFLPRVSIDALDGLQLLAEAELDEIAAAHDGDLSGARVSRVLDLPEVGFPTDIRDIDTGLSRFGPTTFGENAATYLQRIASSEGGALFVSGDGDLTFRQRDHVAVNRLTLSDDADPGAVEYEDLDQTFGIETVKNRVRFAGTSGTVKTAEDTASQSDYKIVRTVERLNLMGSDDTVIQDQADFILARLRRPEKRFRKATVEVNLQIEARQTELAQLDLFDRIVVERTPPGAGSQLVQGAVVEGLTWRLSPSLTSARVDIQMSAGANRLPFILDDPQFGVLDQNILGY